MTDEDKAAEYDALVAALNEILDRDMPIRLQHNAGHELCDGYLCRSVKSGEDIIEALQDAGMSR